MPAQPAQDDVTITDADVDASGRARYADTEIEFADEEENTRKMERMVASMNEYYSKDRDASARIAANNEML